MTHFYFHVSNSIGWVRDEEGRALPDLETAREQAREDVRSIISDEAKRGVVDLRGRVEIADASGNVVAVVPFRDAVEVRSGDDLVTNDPRGRA